MTKMVDKLRSLISSEGIIPSRHENVLLFHSTRDLPRQKYLYEKSLVFVLSGDKRGYLNETVLQYNAKQVLLVSTELPFECEAITSREHVFGLIIKFNTGMVNELLTKMKVVPDAGDDKLAPGACILPQTKPIQQAVERLLIALADDEQTQVLVDGIISEILYGVIQTPEGAMLRAFQNYDNRWSRVQRTIQLIHNNLCIDHSVNTLANEANMSPSTYFRAFKHITGESPIQYIKQIRLAKARHLIEFEHRRVGNAADEVGYKNASQFSREFKRLYNTKPSQLTK